MTNNQAQPQDGMHYITERLMEIEQSIQKGPHALAVARNAEAVAEERYSRAKATALLQCAPETGGRKTTAAERDATVFLETKVEREAWQEAHAAFEYAKDVNKSLSNEKDALQTRSANLRAEMGLAGRGQA